MNLSKVGSIFAELPIGAEVVFHVTNIWIRPWANFHYLVYGPHLKSCECYVNLGSLNTPRMTKSNNGFP